MSYGKEQKEPITPEILSTLVSKVGQQDASLSDIRTLCACLLGFAGFFRFDELAKLCESDIVVRKEHIEVFIKSSKTDQLRDGAWVVIVRHHYAQSLCWNAICTWLMLLVLVRNTYSEQ